MTDVTLMDRIASCIRKGKSFLVGSHVRLDGDGIASALAVDLLLHGLKKKSRVVTPGPIPTVFRFLPGVERAADLDATPDLPLPDDLDTFIVVDVADVVRLGRLRDGLPDGVFTVSIDHHGTGDLGADLDYCDPDASSTGELIHLLFTRGNFEITPDIATSIYTAVMSDTQRFSLPNTSPRALRIAAEMVERGAEPGFIGDRVYRSHQPGQLALWGEAASRVTVDPNGRLAWTVLTRDMFAKHDVHPDDTQDFADIARMLSGVEVGVLFRERTDRAGVRVSLRSNRLSVLSVAEQFGGGGHRLACGCELDATLEEAQEKVLAAVRRVLDAAKAL